MQGPFILTVHRRPTGRYKVYVTGHHDDHLMDWRGLNLRHTPVSGQPRLGFATYEEAEAFMLALERDEVRLEEEFRRAVHTTGTWMSDEALAHRCMDCKAPMVGGLPFCDGCWNRRLGRVR